MDSELESNVKEDTKGDKLNSPKLKALKPKGCGMRHVIAVIGFWGCAMSYATRFNLSIAIVSMAKLPDASLNPVATSTPPAVAYPRDIFIEVDNSDSESYTKDGKSQQVSGKCVFEDDVEKPSRSRTSGEFDWDEQDKGVIQSSFFFGYVITQLPGGMAATKFGGKRVAGIGLLMNGLLALMIPLAARTNMFMLIYVRFLEGLAQGVIYPSMHAFLAYWCPQEERSLLTGIAYSGCYFGAAATMVCSGYLLESEGGWPYVFYITGAVAMVQAIVWFVVVPNQPSESSMISLAEKDYIINSIGTQNETYVSPPWRKIFTSVPVWTIATSTFGSAWGLYTCIQGLPSYLKTVLLYDIEQNSWLSAAPQILSWLFSNIVSTVVDQVIARGWMSKTRTRKVCHGIVQFGPAALLVGAILVDCNRTIILFFIMLSLTLSGGDSGSFTPNIIDIAPNYAGIILGITNTVGNFAGSLTALVNGALTKDAPTKANWTYVFLISIIMYVVSGVVYIVLCTTDEQPWNKSQEKKPLQITEGPGNEESNDEKNAAFDNNENPKPTDDTASQSQVLQ